MKSTALLIAPSLLVSLTSAAPMPLNLLPNQGNQANQPQDKGWFSGFNLKNLGNMLAKANPSSKAVASSPSWQQAAAGRRGAAAIPNWAPVRNCGKPHQLCSGNAYVFDYNLKPRKNSNPTACNWKNFDGAKQRVVALPLTYMGPQSYPNALCGASVTIKYGDKVVIAPVGDKHGDLLANGYPEPVPAGAENDLYISPAVAEDLDIPGATTGKPITLQGITWSINPNEKIKPVIGDEVAEAARVRVPPLNDPAFESKSTKTPPATRQMPNLGSTDPVAPQRLPSVNFDSRKPASPQAGAPSSSSGSVVTGSMAGGLDDDDETDLTGTPAARAQQPSTPPVGNVKSLPAGGSGIPRKAVPMSRLPYPNLENDTPWEAASSKGSKPSNNLQLASVPAALNKASGKASSSWLDDLVRGA